MPPERRAPRRIDTAVQIIYNNKWRYPALPSNATYSFISESKTQTRESSRIPRPSPLPPASPVQRRGDAGGRETGGVEIYFLAMPFMAMPWPSRVA